MAMKGWRYLKEVFVRCMISTCIIGYRAQIKQQDNYTHVILGKKRLEYQELAIE